MSTSILCLAEAAEITKIGVNCFLTYKISYANMMGQILYNSGCGTEIDNVLSTLETTLESVLKYLRYGLKLVVLVYPETIVH